MEAPAFRSGCNGAHGQAVLTAVLILLVASVALLFSFSSLALGETRSSRLGERAKRAYYLAEAGLEDRAYRIRTGKQYPATGILSLDGENTTIEIFGSGVEKVIESRGAFGQAIRSVRTKLRIGSGVSFVYAIQVGYLGLEMKNQSEVIGTVYSNGSITSQPNARITGDAWVASGIGSTPDQAQTTQTEGLNIHDISGHLDGAQRFIPSVTADVLTVRLFVKKVGNPGNANIKIIPDNGGKPADSNSHANGQLDATDVTSNFSWVDVTLNPIEPLTQGETYWLLIDTASANSSRYYVLGAAADTSYPNGTFLYSNDWTAESPTWTEPEGGPRDSAFEIYLGTVTTSIEGATVIGNAHANTITDTDVCGDAYYQTIDGTSLAFLSNPLNPPCIAPLSSGTAFPGEPDPPPKNLPVSKGQIAAFKSEGDAGGTCGIAEGCDALGNFTLDGRATTTLGPIYIPGNLRLENEAALIMTGTIHVGGTVRLSNRCTVILDSGYGSSSGVLVADGSVEVENKCRLEGSGDPLSYLMILTTSPRLASPPAMRVQNNATGAIFYASEGALVLENLSAAKEATAQKLIIENNASVTYESGLENIEFSAGPTGGWSIQSWNEVK